MQLPTIRKYRKGALPNLIVIGGQKCGTTSLHYYLGLHPQILMSREKELDFFSRELNWHRGIEWYKSHFAGKTMVRGESSPNYTAYPILEGVAERMHSVTGDIKLVYVVRDPIDRLVSQYIQGYASGRENRTFEDALKHIDDTNSYIARSKYFMQLEQFLDYYPNSNILIITAEDLYGRRVETLQKIFRFLDVDETFHSDKFFNLKHTSSEKGRKNRVGLLLKRLSKMDFARILSTETRMRLGRVFYLPFSTAIERPVLNESLRAEIIDYVREDTNRLREYTGCDFERWCI
ncbi:MAG: sulfotransferase domain-containing protein [Deltaproteobacteria bacterium]|nr:sulfotransferase domain-containing protein [Deltaproteobacteria bacterium]